MSLLELKDTAKFVENQIARSHNMHAKKKRELKSITSHDGKFKSFDEINVSTKTVIGMSNLNIDLDKFFKYIPVTDYIPVEKRKGRRKRIQIKTTTNVIPKGSIISLQKGVDFRGVELKKKKKKYFLHSITLVMCLYENKFINVKVYSNGKFQITGCSSEDTYMFAIIYIYKLLQETEKWTGEKIFSLFSNKTFESDQHLSVIFETVMQNLDFNLGFGVYRVKLDRFIHEHTNYKSNFEPSVNTSVNIKVKSDTTIDYNLLRITYVPVEEEKTLDLVYNSNIQKSFVLYKDYLELVQPKRKKESKKEVKKKEKYHTFLVFTTGSIIMSSRGPDMERVYSEVIDILMKNREYFEDLEGEDERKDQEISQRIFDFEDSDEDIEEESSISEDNEF